MRPPYQTLWSGNWNTATNPSSLVSDGSKLYFVANAGDTGHGAIYSLSLAGTGLTLLHDFAAVDGQFPGGLLLSGGKLYGTAVTGGANGSGTLFALNTDGSSFQVLHNFNGTDGSNIAPTLLMAGNTLYGAARNGGPNGYGTVYAFAVPEPSALVLATLAGAGVAFVAARRRRK